MKTARLLAIMLVVITGTAVIAAGPAVAQCTPDVPIGPAPSSVASASQPIVTVSAGTSVTFLVAPALGSFVPVLPVWIPVLQRSVPGMSMTEGGTRAIQQARDRQRVARHRPR